MNKRLRPWITVGVAFFLASDPTAATFATFSGAFPPVRHIRATIFQEQALSPKAIPFWRPQFSRWTLRLRLFQPRFSRSSNSIAEGRSFEIDGYRIPGFIAPTAITHRQGDLCIRELPPDQAAELTKVSGTGVLIFLPADINEIKTYESVEEAEQRIRTKLFTKASGRQFMGWAFHFEETISEELRYRPYIKRLFEKIVGSGEVRLFHIWLNTSKAETADDVIRLIGFGLQWITTPYVKIEVRNKGPNRLLTDNAEVLEASRRLIQLNDRLKLLPLVGNKISRQELTELLGIEQVVALRIELTEPGSNQGLGDRANRKRIKNVVQMAREIRPDIQLIAECGIGRPEDVRETVRKFGFPAVLVNAAITEAPDPVKKAIEFKKAFTTESPPKRAPVHISSWREGLTLLSKATKSGWGTLNCSVGFVCRFVDPRSSENVFSSGFIPQGVSRRDFWTQGSHSVIARHTDEAPSSAGSSGILFEMREETARRKYGYDSMRESSLAPVRLTDISHAYVVEHRSPYDDVDHVLRLVEVFLPGMKRPWNRAGITHRLVEVADRVFSFPPWYRLAPLRSA